MAAVSVARTVRPGSSPVPTALRRGLVEAMGASSVHEGAVFKSAEELFEKDPLAMHRFIDAMTPNNKQLLRKTMRNISNSKAVQDQANVESPEWQHIQDTFSQIDTNRDGTISRSRFRSFLGAPGAAAGARGSDAEPVWDMRKLLEMDRLAKPPGPDDLPNPLVRSSEALPTVVPTRHELALHAMNQGVPFVGFGFIDNALMIVFGEAIEVHLGVVLGLSTMAAAGLGNMLSDVAGVGLGSYIEALCARLGLPVPRLSKKQALMLRTRVAGAFGAATGVAIGCLLGMAPLLFLDLPPSHGRPASDKAKERG